MNLLEQCKLITLSDYKSITKARILGEKFLSSGLTATAEEIKHYHFPFENRKVYLYIWNFYTTSELIAASCPYCEDFSLICNYVNGQTTQPHIHDYVELAYVVKGELRQRILGKDIIFQEGDLCLIDRNCAHQDYLVDNSSEILFLCMRNDVLPEIMDESFTTQKIIAFLQAALMEQKTLQQYIHFSPQKSAKQEMEQCFNFLAKELFEDKAGAHYIVKGLILRIFRLLSTQYDFQLSRQQRKDLNWAILEDVCHYIEQHYKTVTIQELSNVFHFQEDYFNRLIKKHLGKTYCDVLQEIRLFNAEQLLMHSDKTIAQIAEEVGYRNKGYFYKLFTEKYGMTPAEYRKQL